MRRGALPLLAVVALLLAGCTPTVTLTPAPQATTVGCARVIAGLRGPILGLDQRSTDAQGTAAWGADPAITLVCGGSQRVSDDQCVTIDGVDWSTSSDNPTVNGHVAEVYTTYGRDPVVQVVNPSVGDQGVRLSGNDLLPAVNDAVEAGTRATGARCTSPTPHPVGTPAR